MATDEADNLGSIAPQRSCRSGGKARERTHHDRDGSPPTGRAEGNVTNEATVVGVTGVTPIREIVSPRLRSPGPWDARSKSTKRTHDYRGSRGRTNREDRIAETP
jgi:hypothetical protein